MFFVISKLLYFVVNPLIWVFILLVWALKTKNELTRKKILIATFVLFYCISNEFITDITTGKWEYRYEKNYMPENEGPYQYAIVLGGMTWFNSHTNKPQFLRSADRLFQAIWLLKQQKIKKIVFTGGAGSITSANIKEGKNIRKWLNQIGISDSLLVIESEANNTHENATFTKKILDSLNYKNEKVLLITSASHIRRSIACFKKCGVTNIVAYPTDYYSSEFRIEFDHCLIPSTDALHANNILFHELFGYVVYKIVGYI